jgi:hypothetical protein
MPHFSPTITLVTSGGVQFIGYNLKNQCMESVAYAQSPMVTAIILEGVSPAQDETG